MKRAARRGGKVIRRGLVRREVGVGEREAGGNVDCGRWGIFLPTEERSLHRLLSQMAALFSVHYKPFRGDYV